MLEGNKMLHLGKIISWILFGINLIACLFLFFCCYGSYLGPVKYPIASVSQLFFPIPLLIVVFFLVFWLIVRRRFFWGSLLTLLICINAICTYCPLHLFPSTLPSGAIKFLSFNTRGFNNYQAHTKQHPNEALKYLQESNADIICLQEYIWSGKLKHQDIDKALKDYPYKHFYKFGFLNGLGCYSRFPILSAHPIKFESVNNGSIAYRMLIHGDTVLVVNNHLESNKLSQHDKELYKEMIVNHETEVVKEGSKLLIQKLANAGKVRAIQAETVAKTIQESHLNRIIVCGDFNDSPLSYAHRIMGRGLQDTFAKSGNGFGFTYHQHGMFFRIDHILASPSIKSYRCTVDRSVTCSDHYPISCYLSF